MKIRITSIFLATAILLSTTGCSLKKTTDVNKITNPVTIESTMDSELQSELQSRMISFIEKLENSDVDIDLTNFYEKARTLKICTDTSGEKYYNSYYQQDLNQIVYNIDTPAAFEHELVHVILNDGKELGNIFLDEGFTELLASEVCEEKNSYRFNVGMTKILSTILGRDKMFKTFKEKDISVISGSLAEIKPEVKDAEEFLSYLKYEHKLEQIMHQTFYKDGSLDNFIKTDDYKKLVSVRKDLTNRIKIYVKNYYMNLVKQNGIDGKQVLTEMLSILDIVNLELFDPAFEGEPVNDFFLKDEVSYIMNTYKYSSKEYDECYENSHDRKCLLEDSCADAKANEMKK